MMPLNRITNTERPHYQKSEACSLWHDAAGSVKTTCNALAARVWPRPATDPREELRKKIVRTVFPRGLTVLTLGDATAVSLNVCSECEAQWAWYPICDIGGDEVESEEEAIRAAEGWLIDRAMKGGR